MSIEGGQARMEKKKKSSVYKYTLLIFVLFILGSAVSFAFFDVTNKNKVEMKHTNDEAETKDDYLPLVDPKQETDSQEGYVNFLIVGVDEEASGAQRTDTIMIVQTYPKKGEVKLASIMRDSYVEIPGHQNNKINASFAYGGIDLLIETIQENFDIPIHYYLTIDFDGFIQLVDTLAPEGLEIEVKNDMYYQDHSGNVNIQLPSGTKRLDGEDTLNYLRFRSDKENDFGRIERQQEVIQLLQDEIMSLSTVLKVPDLINIIQPRVETNLSTSNMLRLAKDYFLQPIDEIETLRIPVDDAYTNEKYSHAGMVLELDMEENKNALHHFFHTESAPTASANE